MKKFAVVTGSTKGIGLAVAKDFLARGCRVVLNYAHDDDEAGQVRGLLSNQYSSEDFVVIKADLSTYEGLELFVKEVTRFAETINFLVLNAAITDRTVFGGVERLAWQKVFDANLNVPFFLVQALSERIARQGRIIFIGAVMGMFPHAMSLSYGVSKAAVHFLAQCLVKEFAAKQVTANVVAPGFVDTPWQKDKAPEHRRRIEDKIAVGRFALPEEVSRAVLSIVDNGYINGAVISVDGGYSYK